MYLEKVTAFLIRGNDPGAELLVFQHPTAGIQLPAGTVEEGETPETAVIREAQEETGLNVRLVVKLGEERRPAPEGWCVLRPPSIELLLEPHPRAARAPGRLERGWLRIIERRAGYIHVLCEERDLNRPDAPLLWKKEGWLPQEELAEGTCRHFYRLEPLHPSPEAWEVDSDQGHKFRLFWAPLQNPPRLIGEQSAWLQWLAA